MDGVERAKLRLEDPPCTPQREMLDGVKGDVTENDLRFEQACLEIEGRLFKHLLSNRAGKASLTNAEASR
jgi:hypothetical protein